MFNLNKLYRYKFFNQDREIREEIRYAKNKLQLIKLLGDERKRLIKILEVKNISKITDRELKNFYLNTGRFLSAGISIKKAIEFQKNSCKKLSLEYKYQNILQKLELGEDIYSILKKEEILKERELLIIYTAENTGRLSMGFLKVAELKEKKQKFETDIKAALSYPLFILFISTVILLLIFYFIVPNFVVIYQFNEDKLPIITIIILEINRILNSYPYILFLFLIISIFIFKVLLRKNIFFKFKITRVLLIEKYTISILDNLNILLDAGISLDKSVEVVIENISNDYLKNKFKILLNIKKGELLSSCFDKLKIFSTEEISMIKIGEETSSLSNIFKEVSKMKQDKLDIKIKLILLLTEPILILVIGIIMSTFAVGLYLPILNMTNLLDI